MLVAQLLYNIFLPHSLQRSFPLCMGAIHSINWTDLWTKDTNFFSVWMASKDLKYAKNIELAYGIDPLEYSPITSAIDSDS